MAGIEQAGILLMFFSSKLDRNVRFEASTRCKIAGMRRMALPVPSVPLILRLTATRIRHVRWRHSG